MFLFLKRIVWCFFVVTCTIICVCR